MQKIQMQRNAIWLEWKQEWSFEELKLKIVLLE